LYIVTKTQDDYTVYSWPSEFSSIMLGATECIGLGVREVAVNEGGYGWVITQKKLDGAGARTMADNTPREYTFYGEITLTT